AFMRAARLKSKLAMKKLITPEMAADLDGPQGAEIINMLAAMTEPGEKVVAVYQTGDIADVVTLAKSKAGKSSSKKRLRLINGEWKLSRE
ncbi:MAG: hypothetical protein ACRD2Q_06610, partial [Terriglobales bacterium]